ncbi:molybdenum ABC transporter ATP-binding protein [Luteimonas panaciterrae]|uniref:molybdenum ABC transporter ATP-binding protein n=1 Tax=Luteimonas panaciterrae TaxID=363885 RepID=UPI001CFB68B4|nr:ATP-binding cassette domain-containing protein [Luteimonas panaciterrae]
MLAIDILIEYGSSKSGPSKVPGTDGTFRRRIHIEDTARVIALSGHSGAGKTSVLNAIAGLVTPSSGRIEIDGRCLFDSTQGINVPPHKRHVGYVFQDTRLFPHLDVRRNLRYGRRKDGATSFAFDDVVALLGIGALLKRRVTTLSGGEAQRVAIGRALLSQPRILLLDEPLSNLDQARREELIPYLQRVRDETTLPIVYVSHSTDEIRRLTASVHEFD